MKTILIIEDDPRIVSALEIRFAAGGYATLAAEDVTLGLSRAARFLPDLILLDISLPAGNGLTLAQKLKELPDTRHIPIIFVTASKDPALRERVMALGAAGLFEKPYDAEELLAVAGHALGETGLFHRPTPRFTADAGHTVTASPAVIPNSTLPVKKVLIIEDDRKIALALALRLKSAGYETTLAYDAITGVNAAIKLRPDLVLLDISMPAGNGFHVAERLQSLISTPTPIIFLTASKQPSFREKAAELGAVGFFEKPYESEELLAAVQEQIGA